MSWNYRVATKLHDHPFRKEKVRIFSIVSCYYKSKKHKNPKGYGEHNTSDWPLMAKAEDMGDLKYTHRAIGKALKLPIIDLDNFPKIYKEGKKKK